MFPRLFEPVRLRHRRLKNRIVFGAHTTNMAEGGLPGDRHLGYYLARARGGAAMIVVEPVPVHPAAVLTRGNFRPADDAVIEPFRRITEACKAEGTVMIQQLYHVGAHGDGDNSWHAAWSPSGGPSYHDSDASHAMTEAEIEETIEGFVAAARRCAAAGFDGVEVWAAYHSLLDQFWTPFSNQRTDRWGGSLENRTRLSRHIMRRIRETCGEDFIVGLSISDEPEIPVALGRRDLAAIVALHDAEGLCDYVTCGTGSYFDFCRIIPSFQYGEKLSEDLAALLKRTVTNALVISESLVRTPENAGTLIGGGAADLVSLVRAQIADPHLARKAEAGTPERIRPCLSCNQQCWGRRSRDYWISCLINPTTGREWDWPDEPFAPVAEPRRVLVIGAGVGGLEAARIAAARGHAVTLVEAAPRIGGQFRLAGLQPRRAQIGDLISWYEREIGRHGVDLRLNSYWDEDEIAAFGADRVLLATGSQPAATGFQRALPHLAEMPGIGRGNVWPVEDVMGRAARPGNRVIVLDEGGNWRGCGTAWWLAEEGHAVTIVTPDAVVGNELQRSATDLPLRRRLAACGTRFVTESAISEWTGSGAEVVSLLTGKTQRIAADALVLATANRAEDSLLAPLAQRGIAATLIGDAAAPRNAALAIYDGRRVGLAL